MHRGNTITSKASVSNKKVKSIPFGPSDQPEPIEEEYEHEPMSDYQIPNTLTALDKPPEHR